jgi:branched-chain amino acid transport system substrate-binding protein
MNLKNRKYFIIYILLLSLFIIFGVKYFSSHQEQLHIAFIGPMSGSGAAAGKSMTQAIQWYINQVNQKGGIEGKQIVLDIFDDQNDAKRAREQALEIVAQNRALAVIGHWYSSASISGGEVYKKYKIPTVTPGSTNVKVTLNNEWYFRNIFNANSSGQFLANYVKKVLKQDAVTIIHEQAAYGAYLAEVFEKNCHKLGAPVKYKWSYDNNDPHLEKTIQKIVDELKQKKESAGILFLAVQAIEGIEIVKLIRDTGIKNPIIGSTSFSEQTFWQGFAHFPKEKSTPGYYTDGIYVATPLIFDTANEMALQFKQAYQKTYQEESDWAAAYAVDTVMVIIEAIKNAKIQGKQETLVEDRTKIRDYLASINQLAKAIKGVTGFNYFDHNGDALKPVSIGVYRQNNIISALNQLQVIRNPDEIYDLQAAIAEERVLLIDDKYMYQTNVVYTGINISEIRDLDFKNLTYTLDFNLWFRYQGDIEPQQIDFVNAVEPIRLTEPLIDEVAHQMRYRLYHVRGQFRADFLANHHAFRQHIIGISFHHSHLNRNNLIYVTDVIGMGLTQGQSLLEKLQHSQILNPTLHWYIEQLWLFQEVTTEIALGNPKYLNVQGGTIDFSQFNAAILIKPLDFTMSDIGAVKWMPILVIISAIALILLQFAYKHDQINRHYKSLLIGKAGFSLLLLFGCEILLINWLLVHRASTSTLEITITSFEILWWLLPAILLVQAVESFLWTPLENRTARRVPHIMRGIVAFMIYVFAFFGIIAFVFEQQMTSLLATSGLIAMIIGLAVQMNISNIFSGIAINLERPFRVGDWIQVVPFDEGQVVNITWRTTQLYTRNFCILNIPNSTTSESAIHNFHRPDNIVEEWIFLYIAPHHSPTLVESLLVAAASSAEGVLTKPAPFGRLRTVNRWAAEYTLGFYIADYAKKYRIRSTVWNRIWHQLNQQGIRLAIRRQKFIVFKKGKALKTLPIIK